MDRTIDWKELFESLVRCIGSATYGKERWFYNDNGCWYDRASGTYISTDQLIAKIYKELEE